MFNNAELKQKFLSQQNKHSLKNDTCLLHDMQWCVCVWGGRYQLLSVCGFLYQSLLVPQQVHLNVRFFKVVVVLHVLYI